MSHWPGPGPASQPGWTTTSRVNASCATSPSPPTPGTAWAGPTASSTVAFAWPRRSNGRPEPTPISPATERAFLDTSGERERAEAATAEERLRQQARQNRRLRALLAGVAVLLVVAVVAGLLAVRQAERADRAAVVADARRVGAQALLVDDVDHSLLLAAEGSAPRRFHRHTVQPLAALSKSPELVASTRSDGPPFQSVEVSPDGRSSVVGQANGDVVVLRREHSRAARHLRRDAGHGSSSSAPTASSSRSAGSPTRTTRRAGHRGHRCGWSTRPRSRTSRSSSAASRRTRSSRAPHYSADGRFLAVTFETDAWRPTATSSSCGTLACTAAARAAASSAPVAATALSPDGSRAVRRQRESAGV